MAELMEVEVDVGFSDQGLSLSCESLSDRDGSFEKDQWFNSANPSQLAEERNTGANPGSLHAPTSEAIEVDIEGRPRSIHSDEYVEHESLVSSFLQSHPLFAFGSSIHTPQVTEHLRSLVPQVLIFTQRQYDFLHRSVHHYKQKLVKLTLSVAFHSASPLDTILHRRFVALLFLLVASLQLFFVINDLIQKQRPISATAFRFTPLELRSGSTEVFRPHVASFGVYSKHGRQGCMSEARPQRSYADGRHLYAVFNTETTLHAFAVTTEGPIELDPARFAVSVERNGGAWEAVAYQHNALGLSGHCFPGRRASLPAFRGESTLFDLRPWRDWPWFVGRAGGGLGIVLGLAVAGLSGLLGSVEQLGRPLLYSSWMLGSAAMATAGACLAAQGQVEGAVMWGVYGAVFGVGTVVCWWQEQRLLSVLPCLGLAIIGADLVVHRWVVGGGAEHVAVPPSHAVLSCWMLLGSACMGVISLSQQRAVTRVLADDKAAYEDVWQAVRRRAGTAEELERLEQVATAVRANITHKGPVVQTQSIVVDGSRVEGRGQGTIWMQWTWWLRNLLSVNFFDVEHDGVSVVPVRSLDQIYSQAVSTHPMLRSKAQQWAWATGGMFGTQDGELVRWREVRGDAEQRRRVKWGQIKTERRAVEKVIRCYGEDVSRLVDVCRQTIVFETVGALADCLQHMAEDGGVELVRVKNRMREEEDGAASAGFRNVSVNLRVVGEAARSFGVDTHVCEVQLLLADFARLQGMEGRHRRYRLHRDYHRPVQHSSATWTGWLLDLMAVSWAAAAEEDSHVLRLRRSASDQSEKSNSQGHTVTPSRIFSELQRQPPFRGLVGSSLTDFSVSTQVHRTLFHNFSQEKLARYASQSPAADSTVRDLVVQEFRRVIWRRNTSSRRKEGRLLDFWDAMETVSTFSVFFVRHPVQGALTKRVWRWFFLFVAIAGIGMNIAFTYYYFALGHSFPIFRFTSVGTRAEPNTAPATHGIAAFGVASSLCPVHDRVVAVDEKGPTMTIHYAKPVPMNGVWYQTALAANSTAFDPVRFWVEGSNDGSTWVLVAASQFVGTFSGYEAVAGFLEPPTERGERVDVGFSVLLASANVMTWIQINFTFIACGVTAVRSMLGNLNNVAVLSVGMLMTFTTMFAISAWRVAQSTEPENADIQSYLSAIGYHGMSFSFVFFIMGVTLLCRQQSVVVASAVALAYGLAVQLVYDFVYLDVRGFAPAHLLIIALLLVAMSALVVRRHILRYARRVVAGDKATYDELWASILETQSQQLLRLQAVSSQACPSGGVETPRQCYDAAIVGGGSVCGDGDGTAPQIPIMDINQIYAQAICLHPILLSKAQQWAWATGGMFGTQDGELVRWREVRGDAEQRRRVKWGQIKTERRAVEKVIRCYGEDVSRLVDVCRQTIVFETVGALADCLQHMAEDGGVELVRVKNRMREEEDGAASAGFRNVSVNLRVVGEAARSFGVDTHVCEVQLLLADFARLQKVQGHKRYVHFRNARGE